MKTATENLESFRQLYGDDIFLETNGDNPIPRTFDVIESTEDEICIIVEMPVHGKGLQPFRAWKKRELYFILNEIMTTEEFNIFRDSVINEVRITLQDMGWLEDVISTKFVESENKVVATTYGGTEIHFTITDIEFLNITNDNGEYVETDIRFDIGEPIFIYYDKL